MTTPELISILIEISSLTVILLIGIQILRRLNHISATFDKYVGPQEESSEPINDNDFGRPAVSRELIQQKENLSAQQTLEANERIQTIDEFLKRGWLQFADLVALAFLKTKEDMPIEKILKMILDIQYPHMNPRESGFEWVKGIKISVEHTLTALLELGFLTKENDNYHVTPAGYQIFEKALNERLTFEEKFLSLYSNAQRLVSGCEDNRCVFVIQQDSDDASEVSGGATCTFSAEDENIYLGKCYRDEPITAGFRFVGIDIPTGAVIKQAYLEFVADGPYSNSLSLSIHAENHPDVETFDTTTQPKDRSMTQNFVLWQIPSDETWKMGQVQRTPDISSIIQLLINHSQWEPGTSVAILIQGLAAGDHEAHRRLIGFRRAHASKEFSPPALVIEYSPPPT